MEIIRYRCTPPFEGEKSFIRLFVEGQYVELPYTPGVLFPLEMASLKECRSIPLAFFIADNKDIERAKSATTVKIKITHLDFEEGIDLVAQTVRSLKCKIRIDANRTLSVEQVQILKALIPVERLDYFEEPTQKIEDVLHLDIPLALDESFLEEGWEKKLGYSQVVAAVVKPYRVFYKPIVEQAFSSGKRVVLSATLEDSLPILKLATHLGLLDEPIGIDIDRFKTPVLPCPIAAASPDKIALIVDGKEITYGLLHAWILECDFEQIKSFEGQSLLNRIILFFALLRNGQDVDFETIPCFKRGHSTSIPKLAKIFIKTSGTTGLPKKICWNWGSLLENIKEQLESYPDFKGASFRTSLDLSRMGGVMSILRPLLSEGTLILDGTTIACFESAVPTQIFKKLQSNTPYFAKKLLIGGAKCPEKTLKLVKDWGLTPIIIYSSSELGACLIDHKPLKNTRVLIDDKGCLRIKKGGVSEAALQDSEGYYTTSDLASYFEGGIEILGRADRVVNTGGEKVLLDYIEAKAEELFPDFLFFAFGNEDLRWGEALCVAYDGPDMPIEETFFDAFRKLLPPYMVPKALVRLPASYPPKPSRDFLRFLINSNLSPSHF